MAAKERDSKSSDFLPIERDAPNTPHITSERSEEMVMPQKPQ